MLIYQSIKLAHFTINPRKSMSNKPTHSKSNFFSALSKLNFVDDIKKIIRDYKPKKKNGKKISDQKRIIYFKYKIADNTEIVFKKESRTTEVLQKNKNYSASDGLLFQGLIKTSSFNKFTLETTFIVEKEQRVNKDKVEYIKNVMTNLGWVVIT